MGEKPVRDVWGAVKRGLARHCPNCGKGRLFSAYLKVSDECTQCGQILKHHQADDAPPYVVIVIVGHILVPLALALEVSYRPEYWVHAAIELPLAIAMTLSLLPPVKGAIVALQWALRMHGFAESSPSGGVPGAPHSVEAWLGPVKKEMEP